MLASLGMALVVFATSASALKTGPPDLKSALKSRERARFIENLDHLASLDGPAALGAWQAALSNSDPELRLEAWARYRSIQAGLNRDLSVPQVIRAHTSSADLLRTAKETGIEITVWAAEAAETVAAVPPYLVRQLQAAGVRCELLYETIADWQTARSAGDVLATSITPEYQKPSGETRTELRIAVIDLATKTRPEPGHNDWLGDRENILMREGSRIAYLDTFQTDGSPASIAEHIAQKFTRKGYRLSGLYTLAEFAEVAPRVFAGRSFDPGLTPKTASELSPQLAEGSFHSYEETLSEFRSLANQHSDIASFVKLGTSFEGRDIFALKITRNPEGDDPNKPEVLITGCYHAREWIAVEVPVYVANQLINNYATDDRIRFLVDSLQIWIVPIVNPDGLMFSQQSPNNQTDATRMWRKNRRPLSIGSCGSTVGVDLNRNLDFQWRLEGDSACADYCVNRSCLNDDIGASDDPREETYRGPSPASEPEIRAIKSLVDDPARRFRAQIDYHNYSQLILYPWSFNSEASPDAETLESLGARIAAETREVNNKIYKPEQAIDLYPTTGSSNDYAYGVTRVAAPFVVEMRPECCQFNVPENEIAAINRENWAGALPLLDWTPGPPILQSVAAFTPAPDGSLTNVTYAAHWVSSDGSRQLSVDTRLASIRAGPIRVKLQFSRSMNPSLVPRVTLGRDGVRDEITLAAVDPGEGWQKTIYQNDTWIGQAIIVQDFNNSSPWALAVEAEGASAFKTDGRPATIAAYRTGSGAWENFEDADGSGSLGGFDLSHVLAPTFRDDFPGIFVSAPAAAERFSAGDDITVSWALSRGDSFNPGTQRVFLSVDGGQSFLAVVGNLSGSDDKFSFQLPLTPTANARFRIEAIDRFSGNSIFGDSRNDFTIGSNVGSGVQISFQSSEKVDLSWSDGQASGPARLIIRLRVANTGGVPVLHPFLRTADLTRSNVLLSRNPRSPLGESARQSIDAGSDQILAPGETVEVTTVVGLTGKKKFNFSVEARGVPAGGSIAPATAVQVWKGKPKTR
jgi:murein tripeptide amidase MpaA